MAGDFVRPLAFRLVTLFASLVMCLLILSIHYLGPSVIRNAQLNSYSDAPAIQRHEEWDFKKFAMNFVCQFPQWCDKYYMDTEQTQAFIFKHQHPPNCSEAKFLVMPMEWPFGVGSGLHVKGFELGMAIEENRTLLVADEAEWLFSKGCQPPLATCYFLPVSNCTTKLHAPDWQKAPILESFGQYPNERVVRLYNDLGDGNHRPKDFYFNWYVPTRFRPKIPGWWHTQTIQYIMRPTARTLEIVDRESKKVFPPDGRAPHPMISMYVRHNDKKQESQLFSFEQHMAEIMDVTRVHNITHIMLGTDDESVILEALADPRWKRFTFHYVDAYRNNSISAAQKAVDGGAIELMNVSIANLYLQLQGDIFVGTRTSNWARIIDELRKANGKGRTPYYTPEKLNDLETE